MTANEQESLRQRWKQHLETWQKSGQSQIDYCREQGLKPHQMTYWKGRFAKSESSAKLIPLELSVPPLAQSTSVVVTLPDGIRLEVPTEQATALLPKLLPALRSTR